MKRIPAMFGLLTLLYLSQLFTACKQKNTKQGNELNTQANVPNVVIIYADDLGYGELGAYDATALKTPNIDFLANQGMRFTNGYASSATCTPSRYALLTGVYPWRNKQAKILPGTAPLIIDTAQMTIPKLLKQKGYRTGIVGKWHLGLGKGKIDWNSTISPGPNEVGFDYSYIMAATQDRVPTVYIENGVVENLEKDDPIVVDYQHNFEGEPTAISHPEKLKMKWAHGHNNSIVNGIPRIGFMKGGEKAKWVDEDMADVFLNKAQNFVKNHKNAPFFLYYAMQQPHVPRTPHSRFVGSSGMGPRGDVIVEADWCVGEFLKTLKAEGVLENTLIIFSSDNGPVVNDGYLDQSIELLGAHQPAGDLRGGKYSLYEAGTRVPFITFWKNSIKPGVSDAMISQVDLLSSIAELVDSQERAGDSKAMWDVLSGVSNQGRGELIIEATSRTAYKNGDWVLIPPYNGAKINTEVNIELGNSNNYQLYNLKNDLGQQKNLANTETKKLAEMIGRYQELVKDKTTSLQPLKLE